jgi:O-antigen ligase
VADACVSLSNLPSFEAGMRSTYFYFKITAGLPIVGLYVIGLFWRGPMRLFARLLLASAAMLLLVALVATVSRGMILAALAGFAVAAYVRRPTFAFLLGVMIAAAAWLTGAALFELGAGHLRLDDLSTVHGRLREIGAAYETFAAHPLLGTGLGSQIEVDGERIAFVHNLVAYHLWKFGLLGAAALSLPLWLLLGRALRLATPQQRAIILGGSVAVLGYLATSAAYKTYYLVWIYGIVVGCSFAWLEQARTQARVVAQKLRATSITRLDERRKAGGRERTPMRIASGGGQR